MAKQKEKFLCDMCGKEQNIFKESYECNKKAHLGKYVCRSCSYNLKDKYFTYEQLQEVFKEVGWELLSPYTEYKNSMSKLKFKCLKHPIEIQETSLAYLRNNTGCKECTKERRITGRDFKRLTYEDCWNRFKGSKYIPMFTFVEYQNLSQQLPYLCSLHQDKGLQFANLNNISRGQACCFCKADKMSGENHFAWKGGVSKLKEHLRHHILDWKKISMFSCNYKCVISDGRFSHIHHLVSFDDIVEEVLKNLRLERKSNVCDYTKLEMDNIIKELIILHQKYPLGVCLKKEYHDEFHKLYTREQFTIDNFLNYYRDKTGFDFTVKYYENLRR